MSKIKDETIDQKVWRLLGKAHYPAEIFKYMCVIVELAIAEEREACAKICKENIERGKVIAFCYGALRELSPCADDRCKQFQSESLFIAISKIEELNKAEVSE